MVDAAELAGFQELLGRLRRGPSPRGERFDLCREVVAAAPASPEAREAARLLLEGAMADAATSIEDAQQVMRALRAIDRGTLAITALLVPR